MTKSAQVAKQKMARDTGILAAPPATNDTKLDIMPPIFHDNPVPLTRNTVGKRSFRKIGTGAGTAFPKNEMAST
jgi:hypothetical protein